MIFFDVTRYITLIHVQLAINISNQTTHSILFTLSDLLELLVRTTKRVNIKVANVGLSIFLVGFYYTKRKRDFLFPLDFNRVTFIAT